MTESVAGTISATKWYRIDKSDGSIAPCDPIAVFDKAKHAYDNPDAVLIAGRFGTAFAIYSIGAMLSGAERTRLATRKAGA